MADTSENKKDAVVAHDLSLTDLTKINKSIGALTTDDVVSLSNCINKLLTAHGKVTVLEKNTTKTRYKDPTWKSICEKYGIDFEDEESKKKLLDHILSDRQINYYQK